MVRKNYKNINVLFADGLHENEDMFDLCERYGIPTAIKLRDNCSTKTKSPRRKQEVRIYKSMPHFDEKKKGEYPKKVDRYACVREGSLIGPAWNYYRNGKAPQIQRPSLEISLSIPISSMSVENDLLNADSNKVKLLLETKDFILNRLKPYCKK